MLIKRKCNADPHRQLTALTRPDKVARQPAPASPRPNSPARAALGQTDSRWNKCLLLFWYANFFALKLQQQQLKKTHTHKTREHCNFHTFSAGRGTEGRMGNSKAARQLVGGSHRLVAHLNASNCLLFCCSCIVCRPAETFIHSTFLSVFLFVLLPFCFVAFMSQSPEAKPAATFSSGDAAE